jgi:hypothetical protein
MATTELKNSFLKSVQDKYGSAAKNIYKARVNRDLDLVLKSDDVID